MPVPRTKGAASGLLLVLLGLWGGLVPFVGPYFDLSLGPDDAWTWTEGRFLLSVLPAIGVVLGGVLLLRAVTRGPGVLGAWLAIAGGAWFAIGSPMSKLWNDGVSQGGTPHGSTEMRVLEELTYYHGLGALILLVAGIALGRFATRSVRDAELAAAQAVEREPVEEREPVDEREPVAEPEPAAESDTTDDRRSTTTTTRRPGGRRTWLQRRRERTRS